MPNTKSAKKRLKQDKVRRANNKSAKSAVKTQMKKVLAAVDARDIATAEAEFVAAARKLDQAGSGKVIHKNTAARRKSRLQRRIVAAKKAASA
jgi:small subunit ribosomal protein S20